MAKLKRLKGEMNRRRKRTRSRAQDQTRNVDQERRQFDASEAARATAQQAFADFREDFGDDVEDLRDSQVERGRLRTGYGMDDEDQLFENASEELSRELVRQAFTAQSLNLRNLEGRAGDAEAARTRADDLLVGETDRATAERNRKARRRGGRLSLLGGALGAGAGFWLGGPAGASAGAKLGGQLDAFV